MADRDPEWPVLDTVTEYDTGWYVGGYDRVELPDGGSRKYRWVSQGNGVVIIAVDDGDVLFIDQYRPVVRDRHLELPAGMVEGDEPYERAAARELREETGYEADEFKLLQEYSAAINILKHTRGIVVAEGLHEEGQDLDENEYIEVVRVPADEAIQRARDPPANDITLTGLLLAREEGLL